MEETQKANLIQSARRAMLKQIQRELLEKYQGLNQVATKGGILFVGDSLTELFPIHELLVSEKPIYNRGIRGITVQELSANLETHILDLAPSQIFLLIGTNNIGVDSPEAIFTAIKTLVETVKQALPDTKLHVLSLYPVNEDPTYADRVKLKNNQDILVVNQLLQTLEGVVFLDFYASLLEEGSDQLAPSYTIDGVHLSVAGYQVISSKIQALIS